MTGIGNKLNHTLNYARVAIFHQAEIAELTFTAFQELAAKHDASGESEVTVRYPVGYRPDRQVIPGQRAYSKEEFLQKCHYLSQTQLAANAVVQLTTVMEAMFGRLVREVVTQFPGKLGSKRTLQLADVLRASSLEEIHLRATDALLGELSYKSPMDFADAAQQLLSVNLRECPAFHRYAEVKATRDVLIHNGGFANDIYVRKAASHARARAGAQLPVHLVYFLESYEACLQVTEWLEEKLHETWHSSDFADRKSQQHQANAAEPQESFGENQGEVARIPLAPPPPEDETASATSDSTTEPGVDSTQGP